MDRAIYNDLIKEHFNISDRKNRQILLALDEADQEKVMMSLAGKLYSKIIEKVDEIDYGEIPKSKGDITKIPNYVEMVECLEIIRELIVQYKQPTDTVDTVLTAIDNMKDSKKIWEKAFVTNCDFPIVFYNNIVLAIVSSVSLMISNTIEFIKDPVAGNFNITLDKSGLSKSKNHLLFKNLEKFNKSYKRKEVTKTMESFLTADRQIKESTEAISEGIGVTLIAGVFIAGTVIALLGTLIALLQELVTMFYCARQNVSDYFAIQSELIALNAENAKLDTTKTQSERDKIYKKQSKISDRFKKISNTIAVKLKSSESKATNMIKTNKTKYNVDDVVDEMPSSASGIF